MKHRSLMIGIALAAFGLVGLVQSQAAIELRWVVAGTSDAPAGKPVPLTPAVQAAVTAALTPATAPTKPAAVILTRLVANPSSKNRGIGRTLAGEVANLSVDGFGTNLLIDSPKPVTLSGVISLNAWPDDNPTSAPERRYWGQGLYVYHCPALTIDGCLFAWNGWQPGRPMVDKSPYRQGLYLGDESGTAVVTRSIFAGNAACGLQARGTGDVSVRDCIFIANGTGILAKQKAGRLTVDKCLFLGFDWTLQKDQAGKEVWADAVGVTAFAPAGVTNCLFVGLRSMPPADGRKRTAATWMSVGRGVEVNSTGNRLQQWGGPGIDYDPTPALQDAAAGKATVADTVDRIRAEVGKLIPAA